MSASSQFLPFATDSGANVTSNTDWAGDSVVGAGFSSGLAPSAKFNKALRQGTFMAAGFAAWLAAQASQAVNDDGNLTNLEAAITAGIGAFVKTRGIQSSGQQSINSSVTLNASQAGANLLVAGSDITITFPSTIATYCLSNVGSSSVALSYPSTSDYKSSLAPGETVILAGDGDGNWHVVAEGHQGGIWAQVQAAIASTLGTGQSWVNVTGSRASGTTYTNSTGAPIFVSISISSNESAAAYSSTAYVGGVLVARGMTGDTYTGHANRNISFIVPNGATYQVNLTGGAIDLWSELR